MERFKLGIGMKLLGLRKVEEGQDYLVIKLPWWATGAMADQAIDDVMRDRALLARKGPCTIVRGERYVRLNFSRSDG